MTDQFDQRLTGRLKKEMKGLTFSARGKSDLVNRLRAAGNDCDYNPPSMGERLRLFWNGYTEIRLLWLAGAAGLVLLAVSAALGSGDPGAYSAVLGVEPGRGFQHLSGGVSLL